jgi:hypothetical protein
MFLICYPYSYFSNYCLYKENVISKWSLFLFLAIVSTLQKIDIANLTRTRIPFLFHDRSSYFNKSNTIYTTSEVKTATRLEHVSSSQCFFLWLEIEKWKQIQSNMPIRSLLLSSHLFLTVTLCLYCRSIFLMNWTSFKRSSRLKITLFFVVPRS